MEVSFWSPLFLELLFVGHLWQCAGWQQYAAIAVVCVGCFTRRGHRQEGPIPTTPKQQQSSVWFHPVSPGLQLCSALFTHFPGDCRRARLRDGHKGCTSLSQWKWECRQGKVNKAAFIWVSRGHEVGAVFHRVIESLLIKVKGVSLCLMLLLDICCFQVEEIFKDFWEELTTYNLKSAHCNLTDVTTTNFNRFTQTTALLAPMAQGNCFHFSICIKYLFLDTTGKATDQFFQLEIHSKSFNSIKFCV